MKILFISHMYPRKNRDNYGMFVSEQIRAMLEIKGGFRASVFSPVQYSPWPLFKISPKWKQYRETEKTRIDFKEVPVTFPRYLCLPRKILRSLAGWSCYLAITRSKEMKKIVNEADLIVAHTALFDGWVAKIIAKKYKKKYMVFIHGEDIFQNTFGPRNYFRKNNIKRILYGSEKVITVSSYMKRVISDAYEIEEKIEVLHNGVDLSLFKAEDRTYTKKIKTISAGFLIPRKANEYVLKSLAKVRKVGIDFEHTIAGDGPEKQKLEGLAKDLEIGDRVNFIGPYEHKKFPQILSKQDIFILPSWDEAFGVVYIEAMAMGLPVIAANDAGAVDIINDGKDGYLVMPRKVKDISDAIIKYQALSPEEKEKMSINALKKSEAFTWKKNAENLAKIIGTI